jgi:hypothetical protein
LLSAYATGGRSSRVIERACVDDVAVRVIAANQRPDHCTIARSRRRHEAALAGLFGDVLALSADAGLVGVAVLAVDGTKVHANASRHQNLDCGQIAREILAEADAVDRAEDERLGDRGGDELPPELATAQGGAAGCARPGAGSTRGAPPRRSQSRSRVPGGWRRESVDSRRTARCTAARTRPTRPIARGLMKRRSAVGQATDPLHAAVGLSEGKVNVADPDSRNVKTPRGYMQGYNTQDVCNEHQIVVASEITTDSPDLASIHRVESRVPSGARQRMTS